MASGQFFIVSAPSGTGKSTLIQDLLQSNLRGFGNLVHSVSHTSRSPREGEIDGEDYHFVSRSVFEQMIEERRFLEWAEVFGDYKGTAASEVDPRLDAGIDVIADVDVQGALQLMEARPAAATIFILPPSREEVERRIRTRGLDDEEQIRRRLALSRWEIERYDTYDYAIINADLARASDALAAIVIGERHRRKRLEESIRKILSGYA
jgi:guanylate kinase